MGPSQHAYLEVIEAQMMILPHDAYLEARAKHGLLQDLERGHRVYFVPFWHESSAFCRDAKRIQQHAKHVRWLRKFDGMYPGLYK